MGIFTSAPWPAAFSSQFTTFIHWEAIQYYVQPHSLFGGRYIDLAKSLSSHKQYELNVGFALIGLNMQFMFDCKRPSTMKYCRYKDFTLPCSDFNVRSTKASVPPRASTTVHRCGVVQYPAKCSHTKENCLRGVEQWIWSKVVHFPTPDPFGCRWLFAVPCLDSVRGLRFHRPSSVRECACVHVRACVCLCIGYDKCVNLTIVKTKLPHIYQAALT